MHVVVALETIFMDLSALQKGLGMIEIIWITNVAALLGKYCVSDLEEELRYTSQHPAKTSKRRRDYQIKCYYYY